MQIGRVPGHTRIVGKRQGYLGLPIRDELINESVNGERTPSMVTAWIPMPKELDALAAGAAVYVRIIGQLPPPMMVGVGEAPAPRPAGHHVDKRDALGRLRAAIIEHTQGDLFWIGEILLFELEKETGFKG